MDDKTLEALRGSIAKWEAIVAGTGDDEGRFNCPLCQLFNIDKAIPCFGCPVADKTGQPGCSGSPYEEFFETNEDGDDEEAAIHAKAELEFLKSLLPHALAEEA